MSMKPIVREIWRHYKTKGEYEIMELGKLQVKDEKLDMEECVVYRSLSDGLIWIRPLQDFVEDIGEGVARFAKVT